MRKSVQKNHNKAESKEIHAPHPTNKKSTDFIPSNRIKSAPLFFNSTSQTPSDPHQTHQTYQTYPTYPTHQTSISEI